MEQNSGVPEKKSQLGNESVLASKLQQVQAQLWLERSINHLQVCLQDGMAATSSKMTETQVLQILVDELSQALPTNWFAIAEATEHHSNINKSQQKSLIYRVSVVCERPQQQKFPDQWVQAAGEELPFLPIGTVIDIDDWQQRELFQALPISFSIDANPAWLLMANHSSGSGENELQAAQSELVTQLMTRSIQQCVAVITQLQKLRSLEQDYLRTDRLNQELQRTNELKNQFLANTSHEIRTPLNSILGFTKLLILQGFEANREKHQEYLNIIQSSGKHLLALINDILDLSKIEANQMEVHWERVEIEQLCRNLFALIKEKAANKGLKLSYKIKPDANAIVADSLRLKQMLLNLLFNALKFTNQGEVGLEVNKKGSWIHFAVWDTGTGISPDHLKELFRPYSQIANPVVSRDEGTGLGLALTHRLAELHQGLIEVESEIGRGSCFTIVLPCQPEGVSIPEDVLGEYQEIASHQPIQDYAPAVPEPSSQMRWRGLPTQGQILLVEDDGNNAQLITSYLHRQGYQINWVKNANQMWKILDQENPELILMDIYLPDANGCELISQIRLHPLFRYTPIIAQTAMAMKSDRSKCLNAGFDEYISKPLDLEILAGLVSKYSEPEPKSAESTPEI